MRIASTRKTSRTRASRRLARPVSSRSPAPNPPVPRLHHLHVHLSATMRVFPLRFEGHITRIAAREAVADVDEKTAGVGGDVHVLRPVVRLLRVIRERVELRSGGVKGIVRGAIPGGGGERRSNSSLGDGPRRLRARRSRRRLLGLRRRGLLSRGRLLDLPSKVIII